VNHWKPRKLSVDLLITTQDSLPQSPGSTLVLRLNQETVHDFVLLLLPTCGPHLTPLATGSIELSLLVLSTLGDPLAMTFRACSSPAPTPVKPKPTPAILSQDSVHTTLSITHHTRKRPSTGLRTTQVLKGGDDCEGKVLLDAFRNFQGGFEPFLGSCW
jgi:hypothetical protein